MNSIECLVVDTAPIIKSLHSLPALAERLITVPDVLLEIKDQKTKQELQAFTKPMETKIPSPEAIKLVLKVSKESGDSTSLSITDVRVIALALQLEWESGRDKKADMQLLNPRMNPTSDSSTVQEHNKETKEVETNVAEALAKEDSQPAQEDPKDSREVKKKKNRHRRRVKKEASQTNSGIVPQLEQEAAEITQETLQDELTVVNEAVVPESNPLEGLSHMMAPVELSDSDDGEWITPSKLREESHPSNLSEEVKVGIITDDFAMQNVCLRLGLKLISSAGARITKIKTWILRCHACYALVHDLSKHFCPRCGNATLLRTSVQATPEGLKIFLKKDFQYRNRGTVYSIPQTQTGRKAQNLILREDQKEYQRALKAREKMEKAQDFDFDMFGTQRISHTGHIQIGYGRKNVNEVRGRRRK
jgi:RNA-binding protein NOB1